MRILKILIGVVLGIVALAAGVVVFAIVAVAVVAFLAYRMIRRRFGRPAEAPRRRPSPAGDVIDVTATEVGGNQTAAARPSLPPGES